MKKLYISLILLLNSNYLFSEVLPALSGAASEEPHKAVYKWSNSSYVGYAWSTKAGITNPDQSFFTPVAPGETDDDTLGGISYAGISLSHNMCHWLSVGVGYEIYNGFVYQSYHLFSSLASGSFGREIINSNFIRSFSLTHQSALFSVYVDFPHEWQPVYGNFTITPVLGGGLGVGINKMTNFQTLVLSSGGLPYSQLSTLGFNNLKNSLAWFVNVGVGFKPKNTTATFGLSYRYYVGGMFSSGTQFVLNDPTNEGAIVDAAPWTGVLKTNQLKLFLDFEF